MPAVTWFAGPAASEHARGRRLLIPRVLWSTALAYALALVAAGSAQAEMVAPGVHEGMLALDSRGTPYVAFVRGNRLVVTTRSPNGWRPRKARTVPARSRLMAFRVGERGPVALVQSANDRALFLVRRRAGRWQRIRLAGGLSARFVFGWPGLVLSGGLPIVAHTRLDIQTLHSQLLLLRVDSRGRVRSQRITAEGFPQSLVPPPAAPVLVGRRVHVIEVYGWGGVVGTIEWYPDGRTWTGNGMAAALGEFPVGPVLARSRAGTVYAAWTQSMLGFGFVPVTLAVSRRTADADFVLDRALTTALALPASGPEVAANEWASSNERDLEATDRIWAGTVVRGTSRVQLDGRITGFAEAPRGARHVLLARPAGLSWFRSPRELATSVTMRAIAQPDGSVTLTGFVDNATTGRVTLYRERPGAAREAVGQTSLEGGSFSFVDSPPARPLHYRAVYTDPASGIPYGVLVRDPLSGEPPEEDEDEEEESLPEEEESLSYAHSAVKRLTQPK